METGAFVNRGTLHGPWLPIYGGGAVLVLVLTARLRSHPAIEFFAAAMLCGVLEFTSSLVLELKYGMRWWDYTGYFLNLDGRICAEGLLVFGIGCAACVYLIAPTFDTLISRVRTGVLVPLCVALSLAFCTDAVLSSPHPNKGHGVTDIESVSVSGTE